VLLNKRESLWKVTKVVKEKGPKGRFHLDTFIPDSSPCYYIMKRIDEVSDIFLCEKNTSMVMPISRL
jgi:hypothetical protein